MAQQITIRHSETGDSLAIRRLAALDSQHEPHGPMLLAEIGGELQAAVALDGSQAIADPWRSTADALALLKLRATQTREHAERGRGRGLHLRLRPAAPASA